MINTLVLVLCSINTLQNSLNDMRNDLKVYEKYVVLWIKRWRNYEKCSFNFVSHSAIFVIYS